MGKDTTQWGLRSVIDFFESAPGPCFLEEFDGGEEIVGEQTQGWVEGIEALKLGLTAQTGIAHSMADESVVFLFDEAVVVFSIGTGSGKG
mgnify:CR=1 FL=1